MDYKAILIKFDPDTDDERIQQIIRMLETIPEMDEVSQPQSFDPDWGDIQIYQP